MFDKVNEKKAQSFIDDISSDKPKIDGESIQTKYSKPDMLGAAKILVNDNKELQNKLNEKGESNMDEKDLELFQNKFEKDLDAKLKEKFSGLESDMKEIRENTDKACTSGDCFADKLDKFEEKFNEIEDVKTKVFDLKLDFNEKMTGISKSISEMNDGFTDSITGMGEKLDSTCTGIECMNKRFAEEDDMVQCPDKDCGHWFSLSANKVGDTIVCPNCQAISTLD